MIYSEISRRNFLKRAGAVALATSIAASIKDSRGAETVPYSSGTELPRFRAPADTCDCHMHIYDSRFPVAPNATLRPPDAHVADYRLHHHGDLNT